MPATRTSPTADGTPMVETDEIYKTVKTSGVDDIPDRLIGAANMAGGSDNITVVVLSAS